MSLARQCIFSKASWKRRVNLRIIYSVSKIDTNPTTGSNWSNIYG